MKKYTLIKELCFDETILKKGTIFEWDVREDSYITKTLPWFLTPLIEKDEVKEWIKTGYFEEVEKIK